MALGMLMKIPKSAYEKALKKVQADNRVWKRHKGGPLGPETKRHATNRDRAVVEVYRFQQRKSAKPFVAYLKGMKVTNWTGLRLCDVVNRRVGRSGFRNVTGRRSERVTFQANCVDGRRYVGTSPGDGMYARLRPMKSRKR